MGLKFFHMPAHRVFDYKPLYYDPKTEAMDEARKSAESQDKGKYVPGQIIHGGFRQMKFTSRKSEGSSNGYTRARRYVVYLLLIAIMVALLYFGQVFAKLIALYK
ncbi:MAG: hypothetical protein LKM37_01915 [Bacteroidales bacterium]|jgi:hypothetical protein|nr:hypothetical protein [Bacteroidales bacterium]MCI1733037.1 hypothetical protein [Bacteroidales bacterium]